VIGRKCRAIVLQVRYSVEKPTAVLTLLFEKRSRFFGSMASTEFRVANRLPTTQHLELVMCTSKL
jgi:hypothetical protein